MQRVTQAGDAGGLADLALAPTRLQKEQQLKRALDAIAARDREEIERKRREQQVGSPGCRCTLLSDVRPHFIDEFCVLSRIH
jgi:hypothetical protein